MSILEKFENEILNDAEAKKAYMIEEQIDKICLLLKKIRLDKNISQTQIAKETRLSQQMISKIESYNGNPTLTSLVKYCDCIGINLYELLLAAYYKANKY